MSRGGRGGARGRPGTARIGGVEVAYDQDIFLIDRPQPIPLFPAHVVTAPRALSNDERTQVSRFRSLRDRIHEGPLYTVLGDNSRVTKTSDRARTAAARFDIFEGMQKYSDIYTKKRRKIPNLDTRPYVLKFFPKELWSTLDPAHATSNGASNSAKPKRLLTSMSHHTNGIGDHDQDAPGNDPKTAKDGDENAEQADEEAPEEEVDDEYASDEEGGDYNAEQYFDDGGEDAGDDYDGGEAEGGEY